MKDGKIVSIGSFEEIKHTEEYQEYVSEQLKQ